MTRIAALLLAIPALVCMEAKAQEPSPQETAEGSKIAQATTETDCPVYFCEEEGGVARGETQLAIFGGGARTQSSDVRFRLNGNTDMTYHNVPWFTDAFGKPPYYGVRLSHFFAANPHWGVMIDYTHDKMLARFDTPLSLTGVRNGIPVNTRETIGQSLQTLQMTDGVNLLTANIVYRGFLLTSEDRPRGWLQPYIGGGLGVSFPAIETQFIGGPPTHSYQWRGPAFEGMVGTHIVLTRPLSLFIEYKFNNVIINGNISGGTQRTVVNSHQLLMGPSLNW